MFNFRLNVAEKLPAEFAGLFNAISAMQPAVLTNAVEVRFLQHQDNNLVVELENNLAVIKYSRLCDAARGVGALLAGLVEEGQPYVESSPFEKLGIMLDCSRNAVMKVEYLKKWLMQLALMGYNLVMLYTEDTYEIPGEPYFGYLRGAYTEEELKEIDRFANSLNMEVIGCIQTLGHLEKMLRWPAYEHVKDTATVMLADSEPTYELIEKMIVQIAKCISSRRIHVGMDETHDLGLGEYLRHHGYKPRSEIYNRHLGRVVDICKKHGMKPMIWSDMYFRVPGANYSADKIITDEVKKTIPDDADFVFWEYYNDNKKFYTDVIARHIELNKKPLMASGVWTWNRFWYDKITTQKNAGPCIDACRDVGVKELFFTMWGDDGAYCEYDSAMAGLAWCAEKAYGAADKFDECKLSRRFDAICGTSYHAVEDASAINEICNMAAYMWDDPILAPEWHESKKTNSNYWSGAIKKCDAALTDIRPLINIQQPVDFGHANAIVETIKSRIKLGLILETLDNSSDSAKEAAVALCDRVIADIDNLLHTFRRQWFRRNKPEGFELIQTRLGGQKERYRELRLQLLHVQ